jgi:hypothetical protein
VTPKGQTTWDRCSKYNGTACDRQTRNGRLQVKGAITTGALSGLRFGSAASMATNGDLVCTSVLSNQSAWLDVPGNLTGGLIFRAPNGNVTMHFASSGAIRTRANANQGFGAF